MDQMENEVHMTQADSELIDFHMEDDVEWIGLGTEKATELDAVEKGAPQNLLLRKLLRHQ